LEEEELKEHSFWNFLRDKTFIKQFIYAIVSLPLLFLLWLQFISFYTMHNDYLKVPDCTDVHTSVLDSLIAANNMRYVIIDSIVDMRKEKGVVVHQDPLPLTDVKKNRCIYLTINATQTRKVNCPDIYDFTLRQAIYKLKIVGLKIGKLEYKADLAKNKILSYKVNGIEIHKGQELFEGTIVDLVVGKGLSDDRVIVPNLIGLSREDANIVLKSTSLNIGTEFYTASVTDSLMVIIVKQRPKSDNKRMVNIGATIDLFYGKLTN